MKKTAIILLIIIMSILITSCTATIILNRSPITDENNSIDTSSSDINEISDITDDTFSKNSETDIKPIEEHSELFDENISVEEVKEFFSEVVLDSEYYDESTNKNLVQKWMEPIHYSISGNSITEKDMLLLQDIINFLNEIEGFPGISEAASKNESNLEIIFSSEEELKTLFPNIAEKEAFCGAAKYIYTGNNYIQSSVAACSVDITQYARNGVLWEEIIQSLGIGNDSPLYKDSIFYSEYNEPQNPTKLDEIIIKILYNEKIRPGMDKAECDKIIELLYY